MKPRTSLWKIAGVALTLTLGIGLAVGSYFGFKSPQFTLNVIEVADLPEGAPITVTELENLVALPLGQTSLFGVNLRAVEARLLTHPWIKEVHLQKRFPQTLAVSVSLRTPVALWNNSNGGLAYVDAEGRTFGQLALRYFADLPQLYGLPKDETLVKEALSLIKEWSESQIGRLSPLSSLTWDKEKGYRLMTTYPTAVLGGGEFSQVNPLSARGLALLVHGRVRVSVELGHWSSGSPEERRSQLLRLEEVFQHLSTQSIRARQVWADSGKKIIVKTLRGS